MIASGFRDVELGAADFARRVGLAGELASPSLLGGLGVSLRWEASLLGVAELVSALRSAVMGVSGVSGGVGGKIDWWDEEACDSNLHFLVNLVLSEVIMGIA